MAVDIWTKLSQLLDSGIEDQWDDVVGTDPLSFPGYNAQLSTACERTKLSEAVVTGAATLGDVPIAVVACAFDFLGGSMGVAVGERVARAFDRARERRLHVITVLASGGARMQEGLVALAQMPKTIAAATEHASSGLLQVTVCTNPTAGGMWASFGACADVILAETGATIGFAGPRITELVTKEPLPPGAHSAESAYAAGLVDAVCDPDAIRAWLAVLLRSTCASPVPVEPVPPLPPGPAGPESSGWSMYQAVNSGVLPGARKIIDEIIDDFTRLSGDRCGGVDPTVIAGIGRLQGRPVAVIGQDRHCGIGRPRAAGYRLACRTVLLAGRVGLPIITLIDTPGADPADVSERSGLAPAIAATMQAILRTPTPVVAVCVGEGGSGGALSLGAGDTLLMQEGSVFSVIEPRAAASILHQDRSHAAEVTNALGIRDRDAVRLGIADGIAPRNSGPLADMIAGLLDKHAGDGDLPSRRMARWRRAGNEYLTAI